MGASWREYVQERQKRLTTVQRYKANAPSGPASPWTEADERAALRAEYFRLASLKYHKKNKGPTLRMF